MSAEDECPGCGHSLEVAVHTEDGCTADWTWDSNGLSETEGCLCPLMIAPGAR